LNLFKGQSFAITRIINKGIKSRTGMVWHIC
jgi:hypothetical protein